MQQQPVQPTTDSSWYERGELPPVMVPVELWFGGSFAYNCEFIGMRGYNYVLWNLDDDRPDCADSMNSQFHPLRTEREKTIDEITGFHSYVVEFGITKREIMSMHMMSGLFSKYGDSFNENELARYAIRAADALITELELSK